MQFQRIHDQLLRRHHLFSPLSENEMAELKQSARITLLEKGDFLFQQGEKARRFYFVASGCMKLFLTLPDGTEKIIELVHANQTFAEALMFANSNDYPVSAQAVESAEIFCFRNACYLGLLRHNSDLNLSLMASLSQRLRRRINEIEVLSLKNSTHRVIRYFMGHIVGYDNPQPSFELPVAKRLIASQLAIQPETFSRIVHRLKEEGIIAVQGKQVTILDPQGLINYE